MKKYTQYGSESHLGESASKDDPLLVWSTDSQLRQQGWSDLILDC